MYWHNTYLTCAPSRILRPKHQGKTAIARITGRSSSYTTYDLANDPIVRKSRKSILMTYPNQMMLKIRWLNRTK